MEEITLRGPVDYDRLVHVLRTLEAVAEADARPRVLLDESDAGVSSITANDIRAIGEAWRRVRESLRSSMHLRIAVVAPHAVVYGLNRMAIAFADDDDRIRVFRNREAAMQWLGPDVP